MITKIKNETIFDKLDFVLKYLLWKDIINEISPELSDELDYDSDCELDNELTDTLEDDY
jgi:hypothetical protein